MFFIYASILRDIFFGILQLVKLKNGRIFYFEILSDFQHIFTYLVFIFFHSFF